jgi:hypothetical protein
MNEAPAVKKKDSGRVEDSEQDTTIYLRKDIPRIGDRVMIDLGEHLQEFAKSTWHLSIFGKTGKIVLQQFGIQLDKF